jgi:hypothetical protein
MKLLQRGVALALLTTFTLASETALAYEQDKTYKITVLHTNDYRRPRTRICHYLCFWRQARTGYRTGGRRSGEDPRCQIC